MACMGNNYISAGVILFFPQIAIYLKCPLSDISRGTGYGPTVLLSLDLEMEDCIGNIMIYE